MTSPGYALKDVLGLFPRMKLVMEAHLKNGDIAGTDFFASIPRVEVPVYFFHGIHDRAVPVQLTERYVDRLDAPRGKRLLRLENSAHIFSPEDSREVETFLAKTLTGRGTDGNLVEGSAYDDDEPRESDSLA